MNLKFKKYPLSSISINQNENDIIIKCLNTKVISSIGSYVNKFENKFSKYLGGGYSIAVSNGTDAIELALKALDIKKGSEVIVPNLTFAASINAIINCNLVPVLADINKNTWNIDENEIKKKITRNTRAILIVHNYGVPFDLKNIIKIVKNKKIYLIEDCAESLGAHIKNKKIGLQGDASTYSFYANKVITTGEGGMTLFKNKKIYKKALQIRNQGRSVSKTYWHDYIGSNYRLTNLQSAIGIEQLKKIKLFLKKRKNIFKNYIDKLSINKRIKFIPQEKNTENSYWLFTITISNFTELQRDRLSDFLTSNGVENRPMFYPLNKMKVYKKYANGKFIESEKLSYSSISLPTSINLTKNDIEKISKLILDFVDKN